MQPVQYVIFPSAGFVHGRTPPVYEGVIHVELSAEPVPYRIVAVIDDAMTDGQMHAMAVSGCRVACLAADVMRGSLSPAILRRAVEPSCVGKLETMAYMMDGRMRVDDAYRARMRYLPVVPFSVDGMLVSAVALELAVHLSVGGESYWSNLRFEVRGSRWMCTVADIG
ncbi:Rv3235 family protein [Bifidobacterium stellenboschense]|uniref:Uncharacterized protein n=1 Tax=Bifidobacterium stellenboschense TaxID=762211 RepID=A0A087DPD9_9BIFI|nr:Rv3235 family protein [Bifidobacterium stellenboschense]KFI97389.1 hypothetical protein BSTEL_0110 [Bifidobacterium stellenboschense]